MDPGKLRPKNLWLFGLPASLMLLAHPVSAYCRMRTCELTETKEAPCERSNEGCATEGEFLNWSDPCLTYAVQLDGSKKLGLDADKLQEAAQMAFAVWKNAECPGGGNPGFQATFEGFVTCNEQQVVCGGSEANVNVILFQDEQWSYEATSVALTSTIAELSSGAIIDADLELNSALHSFDESDPQGLSLDLVLTHEIGHFLGLAHSLEEGSIMGIYYHQLNQLALSPDDVAGICEIFPPRQAELTCQNDGPAYDSCAADPIGPDTTCSAPSSGEEGSDLEGSPRGCQFAAPAGRSVPSGAVACLVALLAWGSGSLRRRPR